MSNNRKQKLELTWIGKENRPRLEPRILLEDAEKSYHAPRRVTENDLFDNRLIFGDNLLALKALEQELAGQIKCIYIDPPYNTGTAFTHYDDGVEHSIWLSLMRDRLEILRRLLRDDGSIWITIDDNEGHYIKVMCDGLFGRGNFVATIVWEKADSPRKSARQFSSDHDYVLVYSKNTNWIPKRLPRTEEANSIYSNPDNDPRGDWLPGDPYANKPYSRGRYTIAGPTGRKFRHRLDGIGGCLQRSFESWTQMDGFGGTHIIPRMKKVIGGEDQGGISKTVNWKSGGGFRYYRLAPSLLEKDKWGNWVINKEYNAAMLAEVVCKLEGFHYAPSDTQYWQHGQSTETDFIFVTTQNLNHELLQKLSEEVGETRTLLVMCSAFRGKADRYPNLTIKKIPKAVLARCEWGHDDYSLQIENLPQAPKKAKQFLFDELEAEA